MLVFNITPQRFAFEIQRPEINVGIMDFNWFIKDGQANLFLTNSNQLTYHVIIKQGEIPFPILARMKIKEGADNSIVGIFTHPDLETKDELKKVNENLRKLKLGQIN